MARANTYTLLPLDSFARIVGFDPFEFNQFSYPGTAKSSQQCKDALMQYEWQKEHLSREEVARAIADAERMLADELGYWPAPYYSVNETVQYPRPYSSLAVGRAGTPRGEWKSVKLQWHKVISGGVINRTLLNTIEADDIQDKDLDDDGVFESFIATVTVPSGTSADEIGVYYTEDDRLGEELREIWRIRPLRITVSGTTATIRGHRTQLVKPAMTFKVDVSPLDFSKAENFISEMAVYRVFTDNTATEANPYQGVAVWNADPSCTPDCGVTVEPICLGESDYAQGRARAIFSLSDCWPGGREPDRLQVNYLAGLPLENGQMQSEMANCVAYLAASMLASEKCGCDRSKRLLSHWRTLVTASKNKNDTARGYTEREINSNPFGEPTYGSLFAWRRVSKWRDLGVVSL
jgi:hypothetical protein